MIAHIQNLYSVDAAKFSWWSGRSPPVLSVAPTGFTTLRRSATAVSQPYGTSGHSPQPFSCGVADGLTPHGGPVLGGPVVRRLGVGIRQRRVHGRVGPYERLRAGLLPDILEDGLTAAGQRPPMRPCGD